jgi:uncharacterized protein
MARRKPPTQPKDGLHHSRTIAVPSDRPLRLAVVADTHSRPHAESHELLVAHEPDAILHGGDIGELTVLDDLAKIAPTIAVRGNIDARTSEVPDTVDITLERDGVPIFVMLLQHIAVNGPRLRADAARRAKQHHAAMVVCGHSHVPFIGRDRELLVFNPGSIGPRRFMLPITFGMLEVSPESLDMRHVSCETGQTWLP